MTKQKVGLALFGIAAIWAILWGILGSVFANEAFHLTTDEVNQTMWAMTGPWVPVWGLLGVPLGALIAGFGMLIYSGVACGTVWKYGGVLLTGFVVGVAGTYMGHIPPLFGLGGSLILLSFLGILWFWAKERRGLTDSYATAADLRMVGYVFLVIGAWFTCGELAEPFLEALEGMEQSSPLHIMIFFALGWVFLFLSHYKTRVQQENQVTE
ncbi:hypothetical protein ACFL4U_01660 [Candidatus Neomarinimicrobiota bacterium]